MNNHVKLIIRSWSITSRKSRQWRQWRHGESSHTIRQETDHSQSRHTNWLNYVTCNHVKLQSCHTNWHQILRNHVTRVHCSITSHFVISITPSCLHLSWKFLLRTAFLNDLKRKIRIGIAAAPRFRWRRLLSSLSSLTSLTTTSY